MREHIKKLNQMLDYESDLEKRNQIDIDKLILKVCSNQVIIDLTLKKYGFNKKQSLKSVLIGGKRNNDFTKDLINYSEPMVYYSKWNDLKTKELDPVGIIKLVTKDERPLIKFKGSRKAFMLLTEHFMESTKLINIRSAHYFDKGLTEEEMIIFLSK